MEYDSGMATQTLMTAEQFDRLPEEEGRRYELLDGELIEVASANPEHNGIETCMLAELWPYLRRTGWGMAIPDTEFDLGLDKRLRPDIAVIRAERWSRMNRRAIPVKIVPDIAVEIVSPCEYAKELDGKVRAYLGAGVVEVWVIYPDGRHMFVHTSTEVRHSTEQGRIESSLLPGWSMTLADLFAAV